MSVVPTYRPPGRLRALVDVLRLYGPVIVSDDGSPCAFDRLLAEVASKDGVNVLRHTTNVGIGRGLNDGLRFAQTMHYPWLLTVDQDSVLSTTYIQDLFGTTRDFLGLGFHVGAVGAETVLDQSGPMTYPSEQLGTLKTTEEVIQSGSLWSVEALTSVRGFDEELGNDAVDAAACLALRERGYVVALAPGLSFQHSIGSASQHRLFGRNVIVTHHSTTRHRAMLKNRLQLLPREVRQSPRHAFRSIRRVLVNQTMGWLHRP